LTSDNTTGYTKQVRHPPSCINQ